MPAAATRAAALGLADGAGMTGETRPGYQQALKFVLAVHLLC